MRVLTLVVAITVVFISNYSLADVPLLTDAAPKHYPLIFSAGGDETMGLSYDANGAGSYGVLTGTIYSAAYRAGPTEEESFDLYDGYFSVSVVIDPNSGRGISGTMDLSGDPSGTLEDLFHSTTLTAFGQPVTPGSNLILFQFAQDGAGMLPEDGGTIQIILTDPSFNGSFASDFTHSAGTVYSDTYYLPEPISAALIALGGLPILRRRKRGINR